MVRDRARVWVYGKDGGLGLGFRVREMFRV
jgi:hypothetical protein